MRARVVGLVVVGLGGLAGVAAATADAWVPLSAAELQLDEEFGIEALGSQVSYLDPATLEQVVADEVSVAVAVRGDEDTGAADDDTAVWEFVSQTNDADGTLVTASTTVACLDRRTAEAVDCVGEAVDGESTDVSGLTVRFPADTEQRDYDLWDTTAREPFPARYVGAERLDGLRVYRFEQEVPEDVVRSVTVPGRLVGSPVREADADVVHSGSRAVLVEPVSGVVVSGEERPVTALRGPDGTTGVLLLSGTFRWSEATVEEAVARAADVRQERGDLRHWVRWGAAGTGVALLALGALLLARRGPAHPDDAQDEPARVPVPSA